MAINPPPDTVTIAPVTLSESTYLALRKLEYDHSLARLGLQGTLWGAWAALATIMVIVFMPVFSPIRVVEHWEIVGMVVAFVVPIVFYGAFIFSRALKVTGKIEGAGSLDASTGS